MPNNEQTQNLLIPNSTQIPDVLLDHWMAELSGAEFKVLMYIARRTYGFKKQSDTISISQLLGGITKANGEVLDRGTGLSRSTLVSAINSLLAKNLLAKERRSSVEKGDEATCYSLRLDATPVRKSNTGGEFENRTRGVRKSNSQHPVRQHSERTLSSIRKPLPKNEETNAEGKGKHPPLPTSLTESANEPPRLPQHRKPRKETREGELSPSGAKPKLSSQVSSPGLTRQYLEQARAQRIRQSNPKGLVSWAPVLPITPIPNRQGRQERPKPPVRQRTYSEERQVLVDVIADLAREFRDEATLTESVSRAYNLMTKAQITDIGVFTSKIYEARAITKERYGAIKRGRMPYFFSVLADVCGQRPKPEIRPGAP